MVNCSGRQLEYCNWLGNRSFSVYSLMVILMRLEAMIKKGTGTVSKQMRMAGSLSIGILGWERSTGIAEPWKGCALNGKPSTDSIREKRQICNHKSNIEFRGESKT
jgi:hypothetical protein